MSYNVSNITCVSGKCTAFVGDLRKWKNMDLPECSFPECVCIADDALDNEEVEFEPDWSGEFSGTFFLDFMEMVSKFTSEAILRIVWEGGDCVEHYKVQPGSGVVKVEPKF